MPWTYVNTSHLKTAECALHDSLLTTYIYSLNNCLRAPQNSMQYNLYVWYCIVWINCDVQTKNKFTLSTKKKKSKELS
jgi:hypothetical protein